LNIYKLKNKSTSDKVDYGQRYGNNLADIIDDTLMMLEKTGGKDAYAHIKYMIPTYQTSMM